MTLLTETCSEEVGTEACPEPPWPALQAWIARAGRVAPWKQGSRPPPRCGAGRQAGVGKGKEREGMRAASLGGRGRTQPCSTVWSP